MNERALPSATFHILLALSSGERHGYAVMQEVDRLAGVQMGPGTLYGTIKKLLADGLIEESSAEGRRRYYRLTERGRRSLSFEAKRLERLLGAATSAGVLGWG